MINAFDRSNLVTLQKDIKEALKTVEQKHGIALMTGRITFSANEFRTKLNGQTLSSIKATKDIAIPKKYDSLSSLSFFRGYDEKVLSDADVNKTVMIGYNKYTILGASLRSQKFPVIVKDKKGKEWKFPYVDVAIALGRKFEHSQIDKELEREREYQAEARFEARAS